MLVYNTSMEFLYILIFVILLAAILFLVWVVLDLKKRTIALSENDNQKTMLSWMQELKRDTSLTRERMHSHLEENNKAINERLDKASNVIGSLSRELGSISQVGPDLRRLSEVLASPKMRGNFGEEMLEALLSQVLPRKVYETQFRFASGDVVDAVVRVGEYLLPIDSKFSLENFIAMSESGTDEQEEFFRKAFIRDVKKRVDEIHRKYILPQEGTFDFAFMYVQSEPVYLELLKDSSLLLVSREKKVYPVSPNSLFHQLQMVLLSLKGQQINTVAQKIVNQISAIQKESEKFGRGLEVLAGHVKNVNNAMGSITQDFSKFKGSISKAAELESEVVSSEPRNVTEGVRLKGL